MFQVCVPRFTSSKLDNKEVTFCASDLQSATVLLGQKMQVSSGSVCTLSRARSPNLNEVVDSVRFAQKRVEEKQTTLTFGRGVPPPANPTSASALVGASFYFETTKLPTPYVSSMKHSLLFLSSIDIKYQHACSTCRPAVVVHPAKWCPWLGYGCCNRYLGNSLGEEIAHPLGVQQLVQFFRRAPPKPHVFSSRT